METKLKIIIVMWQ